MTNTLSGTAAREASLIPDLPARPEESWRRTDPAVFFPPADDMLDFAGRSLLESLASPRPWKIAFEEFVNGKVTNAVERVRLQVGAQLPAESLAVLEDLPAANTAFLFLDNGHVHAVMPQSSPRFVLELSSAPAAVESVVSGSAIGEALAGRLAATVPQRLTARIETTAGVGGAGSVADEAFTLVVVCGGAPAFSQSYSHLRYLLAPGARANVIHIDAGAAFMHHRHDVTLEEGASLTESWIHVGRESHDGHSQLLERRVVVGADARFTDGLVFHPVGHTRVTSNIVLSGEKASARCSTTVVTGGSSVLDYEPVHDHAVAGGQSDLITKMMASGRSRAVFQGLVLVRKEAPRSDAVQINKNLVLSKRARVDSLPRLEILPNEVACKHGSATGEIDARQLYYLATRGFSEERAKALVIRGFALEGVRSLPHDGLLYAFAEALIDSHVNAAVAAPGKA